MVTNALVLSLPYHVECRLVPQLHLSETGQEHSEEIILSRTNPPKDRVSEWEFDNPSFAARKGFYQRTPFAGDCLSGFTAPRQSFGHKTSSSWAGDHALSSTYGRNACLMNNSTDKGRYIDLYF